MGRRHASERDNGELEFTRAAWDAAHDAEESYGLEFVMTLEHDKQRGVLEVVMAFWDQDMGALDVQPVRVSMTWPNANGATFGAFLFQQTNKACLMAAKWYEDRYPLGRPRVC